MRAVPPRRPLSKNPAGAPELDATSAVAGQPADIGGPAGSRARAARVTEVRRVENLLQLPQTSAPSSADAPVPQS